MNEENRRGGEEVREGDKKSGQNLALCVYIHLSLSHTQEGHCLPLEEAVACVLTVYYILKSPRKGDFEKGAANRLKGIVSPGFNPMYKQSSCSLG